MKDLLKVSRDFLSFDLGKNDFRDAIEAYDNICQLRHGIVHNDGLMPGKNAIALEIKSYAKPVRIVIRYAELQQIAAISNAMVFLFNRKLFEEMCERWAVKWRRRRDWNQGAEEEIFFRLFDLFSAQTDVIRVDGLANNNASACRSQVALKYSL